VFHRRKIQCFFTSKVFFTLVGFFLIDGKKIRTKRCKNQKKSCKKSAKTYFVSPAARFFAKIVIYMSLLVNKFRAKRGGNFWG